MNFIMSSMLDVILYIVYIIKLKINSLRIKFIGSTIKWLCNIKLHYDDIVPLMNYLVESDKCDMGPINYRGNPKTILRRERKLKRKLDLKENIAILNRATLFKHSVKNKKFLHIKKR